MTLLGPWSPSLKALSAIGTLISSFSIDVTTYQLRDVSSRKTMKQSRRRLTFIQGMSSGLERRTAWRSFRSTGPPLAPNGCGDAVEESCPCITGEVLSPSSPCSHCKVLHKQPHNPTWLTNISQNQINQEKLSKSPLFLRTPKVSTTTKTKTFKVSQDRKKSQNY